MDWSLQSPVSLPASGGGLDDASAVFLSTNDHAHCFSTVVHGATVAQPVDGAEVRISWRYSAEPAPQGGARMAGAWQALGEASGSAPTISSANVRYLAPVRVLATIGH